MVIEQNSIASEIPPRKYQLFDGFIKGNVLTKVFYIFTAPSLLGPLLIEGMEYQNSQSALKRFEDRQFYKTHSQSPSETTASQIEQNLNERLNQAGVNFQDMLSSKTSQSEVTTTGLRGQ